MFHSWCAAASLVKRRPQVPLPVVRKRCRRRHLTTVQKAASISRLELRLIGGPLTERCHSRRQQLLRLNIRPACQSRLLPNRRRLRPIHGPAFTSGVGPALVALNHKTGKPPRGARADIVLLGSSDQISRSHDLLELCKLDAGNVPIDDVGSGSSKRKQ